MTVTMEDLRAGRVDLSDVVDPDSERLPPVRPGDVLADYLADAGLSAYALARAIHVPLNRITAILAGKRTVTGDTALRLARALGTSAELWMTLQADHDLERARREHGKEIEQEVIAAARDAHV